MWAESIWGTCGLRMSERSLWPSKLEKNTGFPTHAHGEEQTLPASASDGEQSRFLMEKKHPTRLNRAELQMKHNGDVGRFLGHRAEFRLK